MENEISRSGRPVHTPGDRKETSGDQKQGSDIPSFVQRHFIQAGDDYYYRNEPEKLAFGAYKDRFRIHHVSESVAVATAQMALSRGWKELEVTGTHEFRKLVWTAATTRGLTVRGYRPSPGEKALAERDSEGDSPRAEPKTPKTTEKEREREREKPVNPKDKPLSGELLSYGPAPYLHNPENRPSFYVTLKASDGREVTHWGLDLERAREASRAQPSDQVKLFRQSSEKSRASWHIQVQAERRVESVETTEHKKPNTTKSTDAPAQIASDFAEKRLPHWNSKDKAVLKERVNELRKIISSDKDTKEQHSPSERSR